MDIKEVLNYELGHVPLFLASNNGSMCKTAKSKISNLLEKTQDPVKEVPKRKNLYCRWNGPNPQP